MAKIKSRVSRDSNPNLKRVVEGQFLTTIRELQSSNEELSALNAELQNRNNELRQFSTAIIETMRGCLLVLDSQLRVQLASPAFCTIFGVAREETEDRLLWELANAQWDFPQMRELLERVLPETKQTVDFEIQHDFPTLGYKAILINARQLDGVGHGWPRIILVIEDVTARRESEERSRQLLVRLMTAKEEEGKRIARELHDSYGPRLAAVDLKVSELERLISSRPELTTKFEDIRGDIGFVAKIGRNLSYQLHPAALSILGLEAALEAECATFSKRCGIAIRFSAESVPEPLSEVVANCLYRVAEEVLENIRKHAQAKTASVTLARRDREIVMVIRDFGRGFDLHATRMRRGGLGFTCMEERVRLVSGSLAVTSKPGEGTRVEVRIPHGE